MMESELALVINQQMANERERERGGHNKQEVNLVFGLAGGLASKLWVNKGMATSEARLLSGSFRERSR